MQFTRAYVEMSNIKTNDKIRSPRIVILSKSVVYSVNNPDQTFAARAAKPVDQTTQRGLIIDRLHLEPFITALTIMIMSSQGMPVTDALVHNLKIDTCMHCAKYIPKLNANTRGIFLQPKEFEVLKRLDKELPLHVCNVGMGYSSSKMNWFHLRKQSILSSILYLMRLKTATPKDLDILQ
jgi:hypothetical protein